METNFYLVNNYDIYYKIGNKKRDKNYVYAIRLAKQIIRNSEFPIKQLILSYNHIESAEGKTIETLDIEVEMILGPYMYSFENSDGF